MLRARYRVRKADAREAMPPLANLPAPVSAIQRQDAQQASPPQETRETRALPIIFGSTSNCPTTAGRAAPDGFRGVLAPQPGRLLRRAQRLLLVLILPRPPPAAAARAGAAAAAGRLALAHKVLDELLQRDVQGLRGYLRGRKGWGTRAESRWFGSALCNLQRAKLKEHGPVARQPLLHASAAFDTPRSVRGKHLQEDGLASHM